MTAPAHGYTQKDGPSAPPRLKARRLWLETRDQPVAFMHQECSVCRSEGFAALARIQLSNGVKSVIATLYTTSQIIAPGDVGLSEAAWKILGAAEGDPLTITHPKPLESMSRVRSKIYGDVLSQPDLHAILGDIVAGRYSDVQLAAFITACSARPMADSEIVALTRAMVDVGDSLDWGTKPIVDKHSVGGLPGNRTTPIIVAIVAAAGLTIPKTSSRAITSPAGTADMMETLAPVDLDLAAMRRVVEREGGCITWGGAMHLSPADDLLIRIERTLDIDSPGQMVASVLSKKIAAGSTHLVIDMPIGATAKVRGAEAADELSANMETVARNFGMSLCVVRNDGLQPVGNGIGPALEAYDVLSILRGEPGAPADLRQRALVLAAALLEIGGKVPNGGGLSLAEHILDTGKAWTKFQSICEAQGGMRTPPRSTKRRAVIASHEGTVIAMDNRRLARIAKLAGAPDAKAAGLELHVKLGGRVSREQPLFTVHAESQGELDYALDYVENNDDAIMLVVDA